MYFSKNNESIYFTSNGCGYLQVCGKGAVSAADLSIEYRDDPDWTEEYSDIEICDGITGVKEGFLDAFTKMGSLILSSSVASVGLSKNLLKRMKKYKVIIRGAYNSLAENIAEENGLQFLHSNIYIAEDYDKDHMESTVMTLRFFPKGKADIHYNIFSPGSNAGNYGGGVITKKLPSDFYAGCSIEAFADNFPGSVREEILANKELKTFLDEANKRIKSK